MFLKLKNDHTASFHYNESMDAESKEFCFKFNPCHYSGDPFGLHQIVFCFETDKTDDLRSFLKQFGVEMDEDEAKLQFYLYQNGEIGPCS